MASCLAGHIDTFRKSVLVLRTPQFRIYFLATLASNIGTWSQQVAEPWLLLSLGASSFLVGLDAFVQSVPVWLLILAGGILADKADRRYVIAIFQSIEMMCPIMLVVLLLTHLLEPWMVVMLSLIVGVTDAMSMPSFQTIAPSLVRRDQVGTAIALNATQFNLSRILGPALAGILMASVGAIGCFAVNAASYIPFIGMSLWILPAGRASPSSEPGIDRHRLFLGLQRILATEHLRGALLTVLLTSTLCGPLVVFCPVLVKNIFHGDASQFSLSIGAFGLGGLLGAITLLGVEERVDRRRVSSAMAAAYGGATVLAAINPWMSALPLILAAAGFSMSISNTCANTFLQAHAPRRLRGRTISLYMLAMRGGLSVGSLLTGLSSELFGLRYALVINGSVALIAHLVVGPRWRRAALPAPRPREAEVESRSSDD